MASEKPSYGNWIRVRAIVIFLIIGLVLAGIAALPIPLALRIVLGLMALFPLGTAAYLAYPTITAVFLSVVIFSAFPRLAWFHERGSRSLHLNHC